MRQSHRSVLPETSALAPAAGQHPAAENGTPQRRPLVERIAGWSARYRKTAVIGWLVLVAIVLVIGQHAGTSQVQSYDPGQSGVAERALHQLNIKGSPPAESVLVQARAGAAAFPHNPQLQQAVGQVVTALRGLPHSTASDIQSPLSPAGSRLI